MPVDHPAISATDTVPPHRCIQASCTMHARRAEANGPSATSSIRARLKAPREEPRWTNNLGPMQTVISGVRRVAKNLQVAFIFNLELFGNVATFIALLQNRHALTHTLANTERSGAQHWTKNSILPAPG